MKILGIDPGTRRTGVGLIQAEGNQYRLIFSDVISVAESVPLIARLDSIHRSLCNVIEHHKPDVVALENIFYAKNIRSMVKIGEARACAMLAASRMNVAVIEYPPAKVKQAVTGNGRAAKQQVQAMIRTLLNLKEIPPTDSADALALAICHLHHQRRFTLAGKKVKEKAVAKAA